MWQSDVPARGFNNRPGAESSSSQLRLTKSMPQWLTFRVGNMPIEQIRNGPTDSVAKNTDRLGRGRSIAFGLANALYR